MLQVTRIKKGLSQAQLSQATNIPLQTIQKYEGGYANINNAKLETLLKICLALDCELKDILTDSNVLQLIEQYTGRE